METSLRAGLLLMLGRAWTTLATLQLQGAEPTAFEWQRGYVKALEEVFNLEGISLRRYPRHPAAIRTEITRIHPETGAPGPRGEGTIVDLSVGGCGLVTAMELSVDETIALSFQLPKSRMPVTAEGCVRRVQPVEAHIRAQVEFSVGVEFRSALTPLQAGDPSS